MRKTNETMEAKSILKNKISLKNYTKSAALFLVTVCYSTTLLGQNTGTSILENCKSSLNKTKEYVNKSYDGGDKYKGQLNNGTRDGLGVYYWNDGSFYFGNWSNGSRTGYGMCLVPEGQIVKNCSNCTVYVGNFDSGNKSGTGTCYDKQGNLIYHGDFSNDSPTKTYPTTVDYPAFKFQAIKYDTGDQYIGETKSGNRHGYGVYIWSKGDVWFGNWENGNRKGKGIYLSYDSSWKTMDCENNDCKTLTSYSSSNSSQTEEQRQAAERQRQQDEYNRQQAERQAEANRQEIERQAETNRQEEAKRQTTPLAKPASQSTVREVNTDNESRHILTLNKNTTFISPEGADIIFLIKYDSSDGSYSLSYLNTSGQQRKFTSNNVKIKVKYKNDDNEYSYTDACFIKMDVGRQNLKLSDVFFDISSRKEIEDIKISFEQSKIE